MFERIVVAVDATPARRSVVRMAGELARLTGAEVHVLHVVTTAVVGGAVVAVESDEAGRDVLDEALSQLLGMGVKADGQILHGLTVEVADAVSRAATEFRADLLVISPHHRGSLAALFNPRVSDAVAHSSRTAVLLAPADVAEQDD
ncbi:MULTISPECIES: universal stress protein [unclassified Streptomyces]|uniref:universal stress protein n=1 Tax=unclassified Streptomyces TaxID=2593676 RepID=UPI0036B3D25C